MTTLTIGSPAAPTSRGLGTGTGSDSACMTMTISDPPLPILSLPDAGPRSPPLTASVVPASLVVPTIGRIRLLGQLLQSVAAGDPVPAEILIVDQGHDPALGELPGRFPGLRITIVSSDGRHPAL